jgi:hypothetical protein
VFIRGVYKVSLSDRYPPAKTYATWLDIQKRERNARKERDARVVGAPQRYPRRGDLADKTTWRHGR